MRLSEWWMRSRKLSRRLPLFVARCQALLEGYPIWNLMDWMAEYRASTPQVRVSILGRGKVDSAFHLCHSGSINENQACLGTNTEGLASD
ncbi:hypothetical protein TNCV_4814651 [Trichonephila clavipes]|nr:hypothetical protein TNCV_4814651 [Trichonephila clavipes]